MKKIFFNIFIIFMLFADCIYTQINLPDFFRWWDVLLETILVILFCYNGVTGKLQIKKEHALCFIFLLLSIVIGLTGDILYKYYYSSYAIFRDILTFLKFPLTFLLIKTLELDSKLSEFLDGSFFDVLKGIIISILLFGILSLFFDIGMTLNENRHGIRPYTFLFSHPTFLVMSMVLILTLFEYKKDSINKVSIYEIFIVAIILLTMRTKAIAFIAVFFLLKYFGNILKKYKVVSLFLVFLVVFLVGYSKLSLYASFSSSTREVLYKGSATLVKMCFPIGSGFATYASHISGQYVSKVYDFINVNYVFESNNLAQLGDVGFPYYIGQFGLLGCLCLGILAINMIKICLKDSENKIPIYILLMYIAIGLTSESTLLNFGTEFAVALAVISAKGFGKDREELTCTEQK